VTTTMPYPFRCALVAACLFAAAALPATAQTLDTALAGQRVRVTTRDNSRVTGVLLSSKKDTLVIALPKPFLPSWAITPADTPTTYTVQWSEVRRLERSLGRNGYRGALYGAGIGVGVALGLTELIASRSREADYDRYVLHRLGIPLGVIVGATMGGISGVESWRTVPKP
jgi:hypothetical protein